MSRMGERLMKAVQEALDHSAGKTELRTSRLNVRPVRDTISADEIRETRNRLGMSQSIFALTMGVSKKTVESWETGRYNPDGAARRLISILQADPAIPEKHGIISK